MGAICCAQDAPHGVVDDAGHFVETADAQEGVVVRAASKASGSIVTEAAALQPPKKPRSLKRAATECFGNSDAALGAVERPTPHRAVSSASLPETLQTLRRSASYNLDDRLNLTRPSKLSTHVGLVDQKRGVSALVNSSMAMGHYHSWHSGGRPSSRLSVTMGQGKRLEPAASLAFNHVKTQSTGEIMKEVQRLIREERDVLGAESLLASLESRVSGPEWNEIVSSSLFHEFAEQLDSFYEIGKACCGQRTDWFVVYKDGSQTIHGLFDPDDNQVLHYRVRVLIPAHISNVMVVTNESQLLPEWNKLVSQPPSIVGQRRALHFMINYQMSAAMGMFKVDILNEVQRFIDPQGGFLAESVHSIPEDNANYRMPYSGHKRAETELKNMWIPCGDDATVLIQVGKLTLPFQLGQWVVSTLGNIAGSFIVGGLIKNSLRSTTPGNPWEQPLHKDDTGFYRRLAECADTQVSQGRADSAETVGPFDMALFFQNRRIRQMKPNARANVHTTLAPDSTMQMEGAGVRSNGRGNGLDIGTASTWSREAIVCEDDDVAQAATQQATKEEEEAERREEVQLALVDIGRLVNEEFDVLAARNRLAKLESIIGTDSPEWEEAVSSDEFADFEKWLDVYRDVGQACCSQDDEWFLVYKDDTGTQTIHGCFDKDDSYTLRYRVRIQIPAKLTNVMAVANESQLLQEWNSLVVAPPAVVGTRKALHFILNYRMSVLMGMFKVDLLNEIRRYVDPRGGFLAEYIRSVPEGEAAYREPMSGYKRPDTELKNIWVACGSDATVLIQVGVVRLPFQLTEWLVSRLGSVAGQFIVSGLVKNSLRSCEPGNPWEAPLAADKDGFYARLQRCVDGEASAARGAAPENVGPLDLAPHFTKYSVNRTGTKDGSVSGKSFSSKTTPS